MVSGNVLYMTGELGGCRGWAGGMEGVDHSLLGSLRQGSHGGRSRQVVRAAGSSLEVTGRWISWCGQDPPVL